MVVRKHAFSEAEIYIHCDEGGVMQSHEAIQKEKTAQQEKPVWDIVILGGGINGLFLANLLASQTDWRIAVVDPSLGQEPPTFDQLPTRIVSALTLQNIEHLSTVIDWQQLPPSATCAFESLQTVSNDGFNDELVFNGASAGLMPVGEIVDNAALRRALFLKLQTTKVTLFAESYLSHQTVLGGVELVLSQSRLFASCCVAADGAFSLVRMVEGFSFSYRDYHQSALVCTVRCEKPHQKIARQVFYTEGPLAFLPVKDIQNTAPDGVASESTLCSIVWTLPSNEARQMANLPTESFNRLCAEAFQHQLGSVSLVDTRKIFPLCLTYAQEMVSGRVVLLGDASHHIHPLAGQGLNLGLADAVCLVNQLLLTVPKHRFHFEPSALLRYQTHRKHAHIAMISMVELIGRTTAIKHLPFRSLMNGAFRWLNRSDFLKNRVMHIVNRG
jgi:2-polyprenylphenol 6-hydroxylase